MTITGYNSRHPHMLVRRSKGLLTSAAVVLLIMVAAARAADWNEPARTLAQKISTVTGPGAVALEVLNRSSLKASDVNQARNALVSALGAVGVQVVDNAQAATVHVTFSENAYTYLWIAEVRQSAGDENVVMVPVAGVLPPKNIGSTSPLSIRRNLLWSQDTPILDAMILPGGNPEHLIVLEPEKVTVFRSEAAGWQQEQAFAIAHMRPWPRDLRGRVVFSKEHLFDAYMPGVICQAVLSSPLSMTCHEAEDPWPLGIPSFNVRAFFSPVRNFFTGALVPGVGAKKTFAPFYSASPLPRQNYVLWALAGVDGSVRMADGINDVVANVRWGSDIAAVKSSCGSGWQVLATSNRSGAGDSLRAYEVADREPVAVGAAVNLNGPITALWSKDDGGTVVAVVRNGETGNYEAYSVQISCRE